MSDNHTTHVHGDLVQGDTEYPEGDVWYPSDPLCLRAEALKRLAEAATTEGMNKETRELLHAGMRTILYTMNQVYPHMQKAHRLGMAEVEAMDGVIH